MGWQREPCYRRWGQRGGLGESHTGNRRESSLKAQLPGEGRACSLGTSRPSWQRPPLSQATERSIPFHSWPHPSYLSVCLFCPTVQQALSLSRSCLLSRTPPYPEGHPRSWHRAAWLLSLQSCPASPFRGWGGVLTFHDPVLPSHPHSSPAPE